MRVIEKLSKIDTSKLASNELIRYAEKMKNKVNHKVWEDMEVTLEESPSMEENIAFSWEISNSDEKKCNVCIRSGNTTGLLHGVYSFIEKYMGFNFEMCGDYEIEPDILPEYENHFQSYGFEIRGLLPWHNFLGGPSGWNRKDYFSYIEQAAKLKYNLVMFHVYTGGLERYWTYVEPFIKIRWGNVTPKACLDTSYSARWGYIPMRTSDFAGETHGFFRNDEFGSDISLGNVDNEDHYANAATLMRELIEFAHERGIKIALGFEPGIVPPEIHSIIPHYVRLENLVLDPMHNISKEILYNTIKYIACEYPKIDYVVLWQHEHALMGGHAPNPETAFSDYVTENSIDFNYMDESGDVADGCWAKCMFSTARDFIKEMLPDAGIVISGWGGEKQFPRLLKGLDRCVPKDVIFSCLAPALGELDGPAELLTITDRNVWLVPWFEGDHQFWHPQPRLFNIEKQIRNAENSKLNGILGIHWRVRDIEDQFIYFAKRIEDRKLTPEIYYRKKWKRNNSEVADEILSMIISMDERFWLKGVKSEEFYPFDHSWGRLTEETVNQINHFIKVAENANPEKGSRLHQRVCMFRFALILNETTNMYKTIYTLRCEYLRSGLNRKSRTGIREKANLILDKVPLDELVKAYAEKIDADGNKLFLQGELGVLSSINQRVVGYHKGLVEIFNSNVD